MLEIEQSRKIAVGVICPFVFSDPKTLSFDSRLDEAVGLTRAIGLDIKYAQNLKIKEIKTSTYFSKGYLENLKSVIGENQISLIVVDTSLSPIQQRNLEKELKVKVIDRTALILEIFGQRAETNEGKLQVELAHLTYQRSRLVRSWTHLERQRGGAGFLGGPGEKQIELDKRLLDDKIIKIKKELEKVKNTRSLQRENRQKVPYPIVALVGYTNAGKSSLFNELTQDHVMVADMLFATLDPVLRKIKLPSKLEVIISDTVGFISDLPHELVMAFRSTLEEVLEADIVIHVRDISNADSHIQRKDVLDVLHNLGLKNIEHQNNYIEVLNKTDLLSEEEKKAIQTKIKKHQSVLALSALTGEGIQKLLETIDQKLSEDDQETVLSIDLSNGKAQSLIYQNATVLSVHEKEGVLKMKIKSKSKNLQKLLSLLKPV